MVITITILRSHVNLSYAAIPLSLLRSRCISAAQTTDKLYYNMRLVSGYKKRSFHTHIVGKVAKPIEDSCMRLVLAAVFAEGIFPEVCFKFNASHGSNKVLIL